MQRGLSISRSSSGGRGSRLSGVSRGPATRRPSRAGRAGTARGTRRAGSCRSRCAGSSAARSGMIAPSSIAEPLADAVADRGVDGSRSSSPSRTSATSAARGAAAGLDQESGATVVAKRRRGRLGGALDVGWIERAAVDHQDLPDAPGDVELAAAEEAEVAAAQERPSSLPAIRAPKTLSVSASRAQYPRATLGPEIQTSPIAPSRQGSRVSGSTIATRAPGRGTPQLVSRIARPLCRRARPAPARARRRRPRATRALTSCRHR